MWTPCMSAYEPESRADGSIDPLGLQADAGRLADLLLPGFTVRVDRLRALTVATAIVELARKLSPDRQLPYRICLERIFLSALIAKSSSTLDAAVRGFPGRLKARNAMTRQQPLTAERYVKGPATNGLVGAYASLARWGALFDDSAALLGRGDELLVAWERETDQVGFVTGATGNWLRKQVDKIACRDLEGGTFDASSVRDVLFEIASFATPKKSEKSQLRAALDDARAEPQSFVLEQLRSELPSYRSWRAGERDDDEAERIGRGAFEARIMGAWQSLSGTPKGEAVAAVARAAVTYERVSQLLTSAFDVLRWLAAKAAGDAITNEAALSDPRTGPILESVSDSLPSALAELEQHRNALANTVAEFDTWEKKAGDVATSVARLIAAFESARSPRAVLERVVERHQGVQKAKRKGNWMLTDAGGYRFLGAYQLVAESPPPPSPEFLHAFRLVNALSILSDLER